MPLRTTTPLLALLAFALLAARSSMRRTQGRR